MIDAVNGIGGRGVTMLSPFPLCRYLLILLVVNILNKVVFVNV